MAASQLPEYNLSTWEITSSAGAVERTMSDPMAHLQARREFIMAYPELFEQAAIMAERLSKDPTLSRKDLFLSGLELPFRLHRHRQAIETVSRLFTLTKNQVPNKKA